jgi:hypothetical protein
MPTEVELIQSPDLTPLDKILKGFDDGVQYCVVMVLWTLAIVRRVKY